MMSIVARNRTRFDSNIPTASKKLQHIQRAKSRRHVLNGYPQRNKFTLETEVDQYFNNEKLTCLLCGKLFRALSNHIKIHERFNGASWTIDEYRDFYGLPHSRGLTGTITKTLNITNGKEKFQQWKAKGIGITILDLKAQAALARKNIKRGKPEYRINKLRGYNFQRQNDALDRLVKEAFDAGYQKGLADK